MYQDALHTICAVLGFRPLPEDAAAAGKACSDNLAEFAKIFLKEKFIGGDRLSIADYKVAPFFFAYVHPLLHETASVDVPDRIKQFVKDFVENCCASDLLIVASGQGIKERLDTNYGCVVIYPTDDVFSSVEKQDALKRMKTAKKSKVQVSGKCSSMTCVGPLMLSKYAKVGEMMCTGLEEGTDTPDFMAKPTLTDGKFCMAESNALLRYLAQAYAPDCYPDDPRKRARIDWAIDRFSTGMYEDVVNTIYVVMRSQPEFVPSEELKVAGKAAASNLAEFAEFFLKDNFVAGEKLSIADFKIAPFFAAYAHPVVQKKCSMEVPVRIKQFNEDFAEACKAVSILEDGDNSIIGLLDSKAEAPPGADESEKAPLCPKLQEVPKQQLVRKPGGKTTVCGCFHMWYAK